MENENAAINKRTAVLQMLKTQDIPFTMVRHAAVFTMDELEKCGVENIQYIVKNLFLRDAKGKRHFLVVVHGSRQVDLKAMRLLLATTPLSFASEERLQKYLQLTKGSVSPMGILNDITNQVEVVIDNAVMQQKYVGVHPNENTATIFLKPQDLQKVIQNSGHSIKFIDLE